jgi:hypothetical protein
MRKGFGSSIHNSFLPEKRASYFVIMIVFAGIHADPDRQAELFDLFLARVTFR